MPNTAFTFFSAFTVILTLGSFQWFDVPVAESAYGVRETWLHGLARRLGRAGEIYWYLVPGVLLALWWRKAHPDRARKAAYFTASVAGAGLIAVAIKAFIGRTRPLLLMESGERSVHFFQFHYHHMSFPSGHATTAFAAMTALAILFPRAVIPLLTVAIVLSAARVVGLSHYLSDVIAGAWLGTMTALMLAPRLLPSADNLEARE